MTETQYPKDNQIRPVEYTKDVHKIVIDTCKTIRRKHARFIESADIDFENFEAECAERVWKGLSNQFKGSSSVKTYVYIICANHWRNTVHKFFVRANNYENFIMNAVLTPCLTMINTEVKNSDESVEEIPISQLYPEYLDSETDHERTLLIIRKFVWFVFRLHRGKPNMARAIIKVFDGEPITRVSKEHSVTLKSLTSEINKFGTVYMFNDETFEFEVNRNV